jgi:hypothetical protein
VEWIKSGKLEVRAFPSERLHAKLYIMTFIDGHIDKGRVITGSSNYRRAGVFLGRLQTEPCRKATSTVCCIAAAEKDHEFLECAAGPE